MTHFVLIGNPNCGKTTLFNALTGDNQRVGNWSGVTVEQKKGHFRLGDSLVELTDLPGVYALAAHTEGLSLDEQIAAQAIVSIEADCIINVLDACHLERHLYLTSQILELGRPVVVVLNMMDIAQQRGISIDCDQLSKALGCPVIPIQAHKNIGLSVLHEALLAVPAPTKPLVLPYDKTVTHTLDLIQHELINKSLNKVLAYYYAHRLAEGNLLEAQALFSLDLSHLQAQALDIAMADARYQRIHEMTLAAQKRASDASEHFTAKLDQIVLNRFLAIPIFLSMMYLMFLFAIDIGGAFQDFFDISTDTVFVQGSAFVLQSIHAPNWLIALIAHGVGKGINTTLTFIPVIGAMFFFLSLLETSGYMARAAFVVDKAMRALGLPGKSFVPMIVGFGCNVPAVMAARTLDSERDRLLTVMMSPFMSCSARLTIYAVFVAAFFPSGGQNIVFSLYLIGILMAVFTGFLLRKTLVQGNDSPLILELPAYHKPALARLLKETTLRLRIFVLRAGRLIIPVCVILGALNAITLSGGLSTQEANAQSLLSTIGQWITPLFAPMGITQDNWPATVGLLTGVLAKEVVIGTLNALYAQAGHVAAVAPFDLLQGLSAALWSIPQHLSELGSALWHPLSVSPIEVKLQEAVYGQMLARFDGQRGAYAYLLFVLLYLPCVSTVAAIRQEASKRFMWVSVAWSFIIAYAVAVVFYQSMTFLEDPKHSLFWIVMMLVGVIAIIALFHYHAFLRLGGRDAIANT